MEIGYQIIILQICCGNTWNKCTVIRHSFSWTDELIIYNITIPCIEKDLLVSELKEQSIDHSLSNLKKKRRDIPIFQTRFDLGCLDRRVLEWEIGTVISKWEYTLTIVTKKMEIFTTDYYFAMHLQKKHLQVSDLNHILVKRITLNGDLE